VTEVEREKNSLDVLDSQLIERINYDSVDWLGKKETK
jgi:hypothetical protein